MALGQSHTRQKTFVAGLLDIGTAKTACLIVEFSAPGVPLRVLGGGTSPTRGLKAGVVVEMDGVEQAVRGAVGEAEAQAQLTLEDVTLAVACGRVKAATFAAESAIERYTVSEADVARLMHAGRAFAEKDGRVLLSLERIATRIDGAACPADPGGFAGRILSADLVAVSADEPPIGNLMHVVERAWLATAALVPAPLAAGFGATRAQARRQSVIVVDIGAGTTLVAMFVGGHLVAGDVIPVGGNHITFDIARALQAPVLEAERIKKECGTLARTVTDAETLLAYQGAGPSAHAAEPRRLETTRWALSEIIEHRVAGIFAHVGERIERSGLAHYVTGPLVLTGGTSLIPGIAELAHATFDRPVEVSAAFPLPGLPPALSGPAFATVAGMAMLEPQLAFRAASGVSAQQGGYLQRVGRWLRRSS
ncbi:MAG: cell division protein FtsA [Hyphomicrobiaceae bacterium]|nr:cell division protein FtsA [Hyphomicrobiaceae bacterium]